METKLFVAHEIQYFELGLFSLKLVSAVFYQIFISHQMIVLQKCFLFHLESSFCSRDIQICISVFPSFSPCQLLL